MKTHAITSSQSCPGSSFHPISTALGAHLRLVAGLLVLSPFLCGPARAQLSVITDINFDAVPLGTTPPTTTPGVDVLPQDVLYDISGFPDVGPPTGLVVVANVGGMTNAAVMLTTQAGTGSLFMDTQFIAPGAHFDLSFDINIAAVPTSGMTQSGVNAPNGQAFGINVFGLDTQRMFHFGVAPGSATTGTFVYNAGDPSSATVLPLASYIEGQTYHVEFKADLGLGTLDISIDGTQVVSDAPLVNPATGASEIFMYQNGVTGVPNVVALDNILSTVPEPSSWMMLTLGATGLLGIRRRRTVAL